MGQDINQIAILSGWSHAPIALTYWLAMAACGGLAIFANGDPDHVAPAIALAALAGLAIAIAVIVRRAAEARGILKR